jgi:hypothetical protein
MKVLRKTVKISDTFPIQLGESWSVMERGKLAERWTVIHRVPGVQFTAQIEQFIPEDHS